MSNQQTGVCTASVVKAEGPNFSTFLSIIKVKVDELSPTSMFIVIAITLSNKVRNWSVRILDPCRIGAIWTTYVRTCSTRVDAFGYPASEVLKVCRLVSKVDLARYQIKLVLLYLVPSALDPTPCVSSSYRFQSHTLLCLFRQLCTPLSISSMVTPSLTSCMTTPNTSTFLFLLSSSKKSISSYAIPESRCMRSKCVCLLPGYICR